MQMILTPLPNHRPPTRAAEGLLRWRWTVAEIERMAVDGYFRDDERFELVGGEIVPMSPKGRRHEIIRAALAFRFTKQAPDDILFVAAGTRLDLTDDTYLNPDILVHPANVPTPDVRGGNALLIVEVADSSLEYEINVKAPIYAAHGVPEYWVIDDATLTTTVHRRPAGEAWGSVIEAGPRDKLTPSLAPALSVSLAALDLKLG